ncbi:hypothetical protein, partial [Bacteroides xylanisolvens]|uniref:hypothetical protein n=1 Tax=Bacteroides xylanisolvens TaxID=371601 RepID=UPI003979433D
RIKKEEEENHRNKKEITTKFDEEPFIQLHLLKMSLLTLFATWKSQLLSVKCHTQNPNVI